MTYAEKLIDENPVWDDLSKEERLIVLYMIVKTNAAGVFYFSEKKTNFVTGLDDSSKLLDSIENHGLVIQDKGTREVWFKDYMKVHNPIIGTGNFIKKFKYDSNEIKSENIKGRMRELWKELSEAKKKTNGE